LQEILLLKGEKAWFRERMVQLEREKEAGRREMTPWHGSAKKKTTAYVGRL
jgi:hypothetical protein